jgi:hypothetical protein
MKMFVHKTASDERIVLDKSDQHSDPGCDTLCLSSAEASELSMRLPVLLRELLDNRRHRLEAQAQQLQQELQTVQTQIEAIPVSQLQPE